MTHKGNCCRRQKPILPVFEVNAAPITPGSFLAFCEYKERKRSVVETRVDDRNLGVRELQRERFGRLCLADAIAQSI